MLYSFERNIHRFSAESVQRNDGIVREYWPDLFEAINVSHNTLREQKNSVNCKSIARVRVQVQTNI